MFISVDSVSLFRDKLILDTYQKSVFIFNNKIYEQLDCAKMGESLVLANIMTEDKN